MIGLQSDYHVYQYTYLDDEKQERGDVLHVEHLTRFEDVLKYLRTVGLVIHFTAPDYPPDVTLTEKDVTWSITVELENGQWLFFHVRDKNLIGRINS